MTHDKTAGIQARRGALGALLALPVGIAAFGAQPAKAETKGASDADRIGVIESRQQITDVLNRYARGWDRLDEEALRSCFWPDAQHQHGSYKGLSQAFIDRAFPVVAKVKGTRHSISNIDIEITGDRAFSECYFAATHRRMNAEGTDEEDYFSSGRYLDRFERRGGVWKIAMRRGLNEFERIEPRADKSLANSPADQLGRRKPDDPYYAMLADFNAGK